MITTLDARTEIGVSDTYIEKSGNDLQFKDGNQGSVVKLSDLTTAQRIHTINLDPGKETVFFKSPAPESISRAGTNNTATTVAALAFDPSIEEFVVYDFYLPPDLDPSGTVNIRFQWMPATPESNNVVWKIYHGGIAAGESFDVSLNTATVTSASSATADTISEANISIDVSTLTWSAGDHLIFHVSRDAANVADNLTIDAHLLAIVIELPLRPNTTNGGGLFTVKDEGIVISGNPVSSINFTGSRVSIAQNGNTADITIASSNGGAVIGNLAYGTSAPDGTYLKTNGQALSQTAYSSLFSITGIQPSFTSSDKTIRCPISVDIAYSPSLNLYVGISGGDYPRYSTDLVNWNAALSAGIVPPASSATAIAWCSGAGVFIICNGTTNVYTSSDGYSWSISNVSADAVVSFVACSSTTILVVGANDTDNSIQYVWTSTDGASWTRRALAVSGKTITAAHYSTGLSLFVIGCSDGSIQTSPDAITWTARTSNIASQINAFDSYASLIVAVGNSGVISSSPTGATWTARTTQTSRNLTGVAYVSTATVPWTAGGQQSLDGTTWTTYFEQLTKRANIFYSSTDSKYVMCGQNGLLATSTDLTTWTSQVSAEPTIVFSAGVYGNGAYVIVGASGKIDSSADAISWTARTANAGTNTLNHAVYIAGSTNLFIVCGDGNTIVTSPDGTTWTARTSNVVSNLNAIAFKTGSDLMVAVGSGGAITTSTNGTTWTSRTSNTGATLTGVAWNGTTFCAVGTINGSGVVLTSSDGITWTKQQTQILDRATNMWITSDGTNFYVSIQTSSAETNIINISSDGITWTKSVMPYSSLATITVNYMNSKLVAYSTNQEISTSTSGKTWTIIPNYKSLGTGKAYNFGGTLFITNSSGALLSTDGLTFQITGGTAIKGIAYSASQSKFVAVGNTGVILTSSNGGASWTQQQSIASPDTANLIDVDYSPSLNMFVAVGTSGQIFSSSDGASWTHQEYSSIYLSTSPGTVIADIVWVAAVSKFFIVGLPGIILSSNNGTTWTETRLNTSVQLNQICYNNALGKFVIVGDGGVIVTSTNGTSWTISGSVIPRKVSAIASLETNGFVGITSCGHVITSTDGTTWQTQPPLITGFSVISPGFYSATDGAAFFVISQTSQGMGNRLMYTSDGKSFESIGMMTSGPQSCPIAYDSANDKYIIVGALSTPSSIACVTMSRTYNKSTQFALPRIRNTWIKAS